MKVELLAYTGKPEETCGDAAGMCYRSNGERALKAAVAGGHESVLEHAVFTFRIEGVSRVLLAQLTRHRLVSFSVESQRYTDSQYNPVYFPESVENWERRGLVDDCIQKVFALYKAMVGHGIPKEDARYILPQGITTNLVLTANARELRHIFSLRCCNRAQSEIRELAWEMLKLCKETAPKLFEDAGPGCIRGRCPEKKPCGHPYAKETGARWTPVAERPEKSGFYAVKTLSPVTGKVLHTRRFYVAEAGHWYDETGMKNDVTYWKEWESGDRMEAEDESILFTDEEGDDRK